MRELNSETFWKLLAQLDPDPQRAGEKYESLRHKLIVFFEGRGCAAHSDLLADRTLDRVAAKLAEAVEIYAGSGISSYCYGVARYVWKEWGAEKKVEPLNVEPAAPRPEPEASGLLQCVDRCLGELAPESRKLILDYYQGEGGVKISKRSGLANFLGISPNALRRRAHRIRVLQLEPCLRECAGMGLDDTFSASPS